MPSKTRPFPIKNWSFGDQRYVKADRGLIQKNNCQTANLVPPKKTKKTERTYVLSVNGKPVDICEASVSPQSLELLPFIYPRLFLLLVVRTFQQTLQFFPLQFLGFFQHESSRYKGGAYFGNTGTPAQWGAIEYTEYTHINPLYIIVTIVQIQHEVLEYIPGD